MAVAVRHSRSLFPFFETVHLLGLIAMGGALLVVDLRLLGLVLRSQPAGQIEREARPWLVGSLMMTVVSGSPLFLSEATKFGDTAGAPLAVKLTLLVLAVAFTFTVRRRIAATTPARSHLRWDTLVAVISMTLWCGVGIGGRLIAFS